MKYEKIVFDTTGLQVIPNSETYLKQITNYLGPNFKIENLKGPQKPAHYGDPESIPYLRNNQGEELK